MDPVTMLSPAPQLRRPLLVAAFRGWNDAGEAASGAIGALIRDLEAEPFAEIDAEEFFDFQAVRPVVRTAPGGTRTIDWPITRFLSAALPGGRRDVVLLDGWEPNLRWRAFTTAVVDLAQRLDVALVVTLGALQVDAPHTRPVPVTGSASDPALVRRFGLRRSRYEGPTGITGVLHQAFVGAGIDAVSLWAGIPHYLASSTYAAGALTLLRRLSPLVEAELPTDRLHAESESQREDIAAFVAEDEDLAEYVAELEARHAEEAVDLGELPPTPMTGDELAAELERFLRDRGGEG